MGSISVYLWSFLAGFNRETGLKEQTGQSMPLAVTYKERDGVYQLETIKGPSDGEDYQPSLKRLFPKDMLDDLHKDQKKQSRLQKEMNQQVSAWLQPR